MVMGFPNVTDNITNSLVLYMHIKFGCNYIDNKSEEKMSIRKYIHCAEYWNYDVLFLESLSIP